MNKFNDIDLTRGYQKYDAMVKNIEGIFNKINQLFDISEYKKELDKIFNNESVFGCLLESRTNVISEKKFPFIHIKQRSRQTSSKADDTSRSRP